MATSSWEPVHIAKEAQSSELGTGASGNKAKSYCSEIVQRNKMS